MHGTGTFQTLTRTVIFTVPTLLRPRPIVSDIGMRRQAGRGTPGFVATEAVTAETVAEPSTDVVSLGVMLVIVALKPGLREHNIFAHDVRRRKRLRAG